MKTKVIIEGGGEDRYSAYIAEDGAPYGLIGEGRTVAETRQDFLTAYEEMRQLYAEEGREFQELEFEFLYDLPSFLRSWAYALTLAGLSRITGVNQGQLSHYINGTSRPGRRTVEKIQAGISRFAGELAGVRFV